MTSRRRALVALVASTALLLGSGVAWAVAAQRVVGGELDRMSQARAAVSATVSRAPSRPRAADLPASDGAAVGPAVAARDAEPSLSIDVGDVPVVDATTIEKPARVRAPRELRMPSLDLGMRVRATGVSPDGQMELPDDPTVLGWYRFGASPGDDGGSAVLAGHVDSLDRGVGPLATLASAAVGDRVVVMDANGSPVRYQVSSVRRIEKAALPVDRLFRPGGPHQLAVITCGGRYLPDAGGYEDNIVVIARPVGA